VNSNNNGYNTEKYIGNYRGTPVLGLISSFYSVHYMYIYNILLKKKIRNIEI